MLLVVLVVLVVQVAVVLDGRIQIGDDIDFHEIENLEKLGSQQRVNKSLCSLQTIASVHVYLLSR